MRAHHRARNLLWAPVTSPLGDESGFQPLNAHFSPSVVLARLGLKAAGKA